MSIYQSTDPLGIETGFMGRMPESVEDVKKELEAIRANAEKAKSMYDNKFNANEWKDGTAGYTETPGLWEDYEATPGGFLTPELSLSFHLTDKQIADCRK